MKKYAIVLAAGTGARFGTMCPKQFLIVCGKMIIEHTLDACDCGLFDRIILVVPKSYVERVRSAVALDSYNTPIQIVTGGTTRFDSCRRGLEAIKGPGVVIVQNGDQPLTSSSVFSRCLSELRTHLAVTSGSSCTYTVLETDNDGMLMRLRPRKNCYNDLGPECFRLPVLRRVLQVIKSDVAFTNLTGAVVKHGLGGVRVIPGDPLNIKITYPEDLALVRKLLQKRKRKAFMITQTPLVESDYRGLD